MPVPFPSSFIASSRLHRNAKSLRSAGSGDASELEYSFLRCLGTTFAVSTTLALFTYDVLLSLDDEISFIWNSPWSLLKVSYLLARYMTFIDLGLTVYASTAFILSEHTCLRVYRMIPWFYVVGVAFGELILTLRAWAFCRKQRHILIILSSAYMITWIIEVALSGFQALSYEFAIQGLMRSLKRPSCILTGGRETLIFVNLALLLAYDALVTLFMVLPAVRIFRAGGGSTILYNIFKDGVMFYICLFSVTLANMIVIPTLSPDYFSIIVMFERAIHAIVACRVVLNVRKQLQKDDVDTISFHTISGV